MSAGKPGVGSGEKERENAQPFIVRNLVDFEEVDVAVTPKQRGETARLSREALIDRASFGVDQLHMICVSNGHCPSLQIWHNYTLTQRMMWALSFILASAKSSGHRLYLELERGWGWTHFTLYESHSTCGFNLSSLHLAYFLSFLPDFLDAHRTICLHWLNESLVVKCILSSKCRRMTVRVRVDFLLQVRD